MSEPAEHAPFGERPEQGEGEAIDALPVLAAPRITPRRIEEPALELRPALALPAVQAAAVAAGGFVAGAAVAGLVHRHRRTRALAAGRRAAGALRGERRSPAAELVQIVGSRSLLVDVHLLGGQGRGA